MKRSRYIVSACLIGRRCRYDGGHKAHTGVTRFLRGKKYLAVCPEMLAGWSAPRPQVEYHGGGAAEVLEEKASIKDRRGRDRTKSLMKGVIKAVKQAESSGVKEAILKENSPSCGVNRVYRDGKLTRGQGLFTYGLKKKGIRIRSEKNFEAKGGYEPTRR